MVFGIKDSHFRVDSRLVGHEAWREIQIQFRELMIPITYVKGATFLHFLPQTGQNQSEIIKYKVRSAQKQPLDVRNWNHRVPEFEFEFPAEANVLPVWNPL